MNFDTSLLQELLSRLAAIRPTMAEGDRSLIQPSLDNTPKTGPVDVAGYDCETIDAHLRELQSRGLIDSGGIVNPLLGIFFESITPRGRSWLA